MTVFIDYPKPNDSLGSLYTVNIFADSAESVRLSIDNGPWSPCRYGDGRWWFDWINIEPGLHTLQAEATQSGQVVKSTIVECSREMEPIFPASAPAPNLTTPPTLQEIWVAAQQKLKDSLDDPKIDLWLNEINPLEIQGDTLILGVPNSFFEGWVEKSAPKILSSLQEINAEIQKLECRTVDLPESPQQELSPSLKEKKPPKKISVRKPFQLPSQSFHEKIRFSLPVSVASTELAKKLKQWKVEITRRIDGKTTNLLWVFHVREDEHIPGPDCEDLRLAVERILTDRRKHRADGKIRPLEQFTGYEIYQAMGKKGYMGNRQYKLMAENLIRLARTNYLLEHTSLSEDQRRQGIGIERWHFWEKIYLRDDKLPDGTKSQHITIQLNPEYLAALNSESKTQRLMPYNDDLLLCLTKGVSRRLLRILEARFYGMTGTYAPFAYPQLCGLLGIMPEKELWRAKQQLKPYHQELMNFHKLYQKWQKENREKDEKPKPPILLREPEWDDRSDPWRVIYYPGPGAKIHPRHHKPKAVQPPLPFIQPA